MPQPDIAAVSSTLHGLTRQGCVERAPRASYSLVSTAVQDRTTRPAVVIDGNGQGNAFPGTFPAEPLELQRTGTGKPGVPSCTESATRQPPSLQVEEVAAGGRLAADSVDTMGAPVFPAPSWWRLARST